jgi:hypothetical protein
MRPRRMGLNPWDILRLAFIAAMVSAIVATITATDARQADPDAMSHKGGLCIHNPPTD